VCRGCPPVALTPLAMLGFGIDEPARLFLIVYLAAVLMVPSTVSGVRSVPPIRLRAAASLGAPVVELHTGAYAHGQDSELDRLRTEKRREIAERIAAAREFGEIAENAEYDDAKNEQMMLEHRIAQLEERLANARVIDVKKVDTSVVSVGSVVRLRDVDAKETVKYHIVGSAEANPAEFKLSNESPVGRAILGHKKGETVEVLTPRGSKIKFKIMEISAA